MSFHNSILAVPDYNNQAQVATVEYNYKTTAAFIIKYIKIILSFMITPFHSDE